MSGRWFHLTPRRRLAPFLVAFAVFTAIALACGDDAGEDALSPTATPGVHQLPPGSTMAAIKDRGRLVVGVKHDVPLFGIRDPATGRVDGFDVAMGREVGKALGLREDQIQFVEAVTANRIPFLQEERADLIISTFTITAERKGQVEFSRPYYQAGQSILVRKDNTDIKSATDLNGQDGLRASRLNQRARRAGQSPAGGHAPSPHRLRLRVVPEGRPH